MNTTSKTNWERVDALTDNDIDTSDIPTLDENFFQQAQLRIPARANTVMIEIDPETLAWYEAQGEARTAAMIAALKIYAQAHQSLPKSA